MLDCPDWSVNLLWRKGRYVPVDTASYSRTLGLYESQTSLMNCFDAFTFFPPRYLIHFPDECTIHEHTMTFSRYRASTINNIIR
jgi:hypothetical protein